jgi:hypothetical protein
MHIHHKHGSQAPIRGEFPNCYTGFELQEADYLVNDFKIDEDIEIIKVIYKFDTVSIYDNPSAIILFRRVDSDVIDYALVKRYNNTSINFGFQNQFERVYGLTPGTFLSAGTEVVVPKSKNLSTGEYKNGWNANVLFKSDIETHEDAFPISESFAKRLGALTIETVVIEFDNDRQPLNLYGDASSYKIIPDLGEAIADNGILATTRKTSAQNMICDLNIFECSKANTLHDRVYYAQPGAKIIDVNVYSNDPLNGQLKDYYDAQVRQCINVYQAVQAIPNAKLSNKLNTLMTECIKLLRREGVICARKKNITLTYSNQPINTRVEVTFVYEQAIAPGFKLSGRDGGKGVAVVVRPDNEMPIDENGIRADLIMDTASIVKRTIFSQLYEQFYNRGGLLMLKRTLDLDTDTRYAKVLAYVRATNPDYGDLIDQAYGMSTNDKAEFLQEADENGLKLFFPPTANWVDTNHVLQLDEAFDLKATHIIFAVEDEDGVIRYQKSKYPAMIGSKFIYLLDKLPDMLGISVGPTNTLNVPTKGIREKVFNLVKTPTRFGEDEKRMLYSTVVPENVERFYGLQAFSREGVEDTIKTILEADNPIDIHVPISNDELKHTSAIIRELDNYLKIIGVVISHAKEMK